MSAYDELAAAVAVHGPFPMPTGDTGSVAMKPEQRAAIAVQIGDVQSATDALIGTFAESVANVRNHEHPSWEDLYCMNLTSYMGERMAPVLKRLLDAETESARLRARVAELESPRPVRQFSRLEEAVQGVETAIAPLTGDQRAGADMVLAYLRTLTTPGAVTEVDRLSDELTGRSLALYEEKQDTARLRLALASAKRGRREARARVVELEAEREAVLSLHRKHTDSDHCFADDETWPCQTRTALDSPDAGTPRLTGLPLGLTGRARHDARVAVEAARRNLRPGAEAARRMIADRQTAEDPHDSPLHRTYETSHDLPEVTS